VSDAAPQSGVGEWGRRVGLLGGSFNPAHDGHRHISRIALDRLALDEVWWLVSPQNPLKAADGLAPLAERMAAARAIADDPRLIVTDIERELGTIFTVDTVDALKRRFEHHRFVWLMGADILVQMPRWRRWYRLFASVPIGVFPRPTYSSRALSGTAARRFAGKKIRESQAPLLADMRPPAWVFLRARPHTASATRIREGR